MLQKSPKKSEPFKEDKTIPIHKIVKNLQKSAEKSELYSKIPCVAIACGAFSPIHIMHVQMFEIVKQILENTGKLVLVGGFISPSHDDYVSHKMLRKYGNSPPKNFKYLDSKQRLELIDLATEDSSWITSCSFESNYCKFISFATVTNMVASYLHSHPTIQNLLSKFGVRLRIVFVCGSDLICRGSFSEFQYDSLDIQVCCVGRSSTTNVNDPINAELMEAKRRITNYQLVNKRPVYFLESDPKYITPVSSSHVRQLLEVIQNLAPNKEKTDDQLKELQEAENAIGQVLHPKVLEYLLTMYEKS